MRVVALFLFLFPVACTVYQSDGRQIIEKNKLQAVGAYGFDPVSKTQYSCFMSADLPEVLQMPNTVIETEYEKDGFSTLETVAEIEPQLIVYKYDHERDHHHYCNLRMMEPSKVSQKSAIRLSVNLLTDQVARLGFY